MKGGGTGYSGGCGLVRQSARRGAVGVGGQGSGGTWCGVGGGARGRAPFAFTNTRHTPLKVFYSYGTGLWLIAKRREASTFAWPKIEEIGAARLVFLREVFAMLTDWINLCGAKKRPWFERGK